MINPLAKELNDVLAGTVAGDLLSDLGERLYFPKGIIAQGGEAKKLGKKANCTIGITLVDGKPAVLPSVQAVVPELESRELVSYSPTAGNPDIRAAWKAAQIKKNPLLKEKSTSLPVVVPGLTAGISYLADLFLDESKPLVAADPSWDNYVLIASARRNAGFVQFQMFKDGKFNIEGLKATLTEQANACGSVRVLLNFPQNPSGYSPTAAEAKQLVSIVKEIADSGKKVMVWCDDAYFGLNYESDIESQSLFAYLADLSPNVLAAKIDGPTKEDFAWGFRCGFITFGCKGFTEEQYDALVKKLMAAIFNTFKIRCCHGRINVYRIILIYDIIVRICDCKFVRHNKSSAIEPLPFNSGYFMSLHTKTVDAEVLRQKLLKEKEIGTISIDPHTLRVAFSSLEEDKIDFVYKAIYDTAEELSK